MKADSSAEVDKSMRISLWSKKLMILNLYGWSIIDKSKIYWKNMCNIDSPYLYFKKQCGIISKLINQWFLKINEEELIEKKMKKNDSPGFGYCIQYTYACFKIPKLIKEIKY